MDRNPTDLGAVPDHANQGLSMLSLPADSTSVAIMLVDEDGAADVTWVRGCFDLTDSLCTAQGASCFCEVILTLLDPSDEVLNLFRVEPLAFPRLRSRGILKVEKWDPETQQTEILISPPT